MNRVWEMADAVIRDETGLHARPAVKLTKLAKRFAAQVEIRRSGQGGWINAKSPSAVMKLRAPTRATVEIRASGHDALSAVEAIRELINRDFDDVAAE